ncbi:hypothetical protein GCM10009682_05650 [Luedemannella flava]|uniref:Leucine-binding protein domain-containing protein n=1 Tax=Luedemannella flava TaxID=349316 RepID=A0ABP4XRS7_9ACTN
MGQVDRRQLLRLFGAAATAGAAAAALAACGGSASGSKEQISGRRVRVGLLAPKDGPYAAIGADITDGFKLYLDEHRNVLGRHPVELIIADEGTTVDAARKATEGLLAQQVHVIAGVASPAALSGIRDLVEKARVPLIGANGSPGDLTSVYYIWRASYADGQASTALGDYLADQGRYRRAYVLHDGTSQGLAEADAFRRAFSSTGRTIVGQAAGTGSYSARLQGAAGTSAEIIYCAYSGDAAWQLLKAYAGTGLTKPLVGPGMLTEIRDLTKLAKDLKRLPEVYTAMNYTPDLQLAANRRFAAAYSNATGVQPTAYAMAAYDTAGVLDNALRLISDDITAMEVNRGISALGEIQSPRGTWTFNNTRTPQQKWYLRKLELSGQVPANLITAELATLS